MFPLWLKIAYTLGVLVILAVYWVKYGPQNYLWFSDIALIGAVPGLWLESGVIASTLCVLVLLPELVWNVSFFVRLLTGWRLSGLSDYMFEARRPLFLRALSLFHVVLPPLLLWMVARLGYIESAWWIAIVLAWIVLPLSFWLTKPAANINWVHGRPGHPWPAGAYLAAMMVAMPLCAFLPAHALLRWWFD